VPSPEPFLVLSWVFARELEILLDARPSRWLPVVSPDARCIALLRVEESTMEPFDTVRLDLLLEDLRALPEDEMRLLLSTVAVAYPEVVRLALTMLERVADSVSEAPGG
jgi:hypothetical protein